MLTDQGLGRLFLVRAMGGGGPKQGVLPGDHIIEGMSAPLIRDGRVRPIAVTTAQRLAAFPDLPTVAETGVPGYEVSTWFALFAAAATPQEIVQRLNREFAVALADADIREKLMAQGYTINGGSPQDLGNLVRAELVKWARVVKESGAKVE